MKQMIFFSATCLVFLQLACNSAGTSNDAAANNTKTVVVDDESKRMIGKNEMVYRAIESGNFNGLDTIMASDVIDHTTPSGKEIKGKDSILSMLKTFSASMKNVKIETKATSYDPDKGIIFSLVRTTGTSLKDMDGMRANTPIDMTTVDVVKVSNGKITDHWGYEDPAEIMNMMAKQPSGKH